MGRPVRFVILLAAAALLCAGCGNGATSQSDISVDAAKMLADGQGKPQADMSNAVNGTGGPVAWGHKPQRK